MKKLLYLLLIPCSLFLFSCEKDEKTEPETKTTAPTHNTELVANASTNFQYVSYAILNGGLRDSVFVPTNNNWSHNLDLVVGDTISINTVTADSSKADLFINYSGTGRVKDNGYYSYNSADGISTLTGIIVE